MTVLKGWKSNTIKLIKAQLKHLRKIALKAIKGKRTTLVGTFSGLLKILIRHKAVLSNLKSEFLGTYLLF